MRLRKQLLLLSLATLALPWAGVKTLQKLEQTLHLGQVETLRATSKAIAAVVTRDSNWISAATASAQPQSSPVLVLHPLTSPIFVDGYDEDWRAYPFIRQSLKGDGSVQGDWLAGVWGSSVFFTISIRDAHRQFFNPTQALALSDHIRLRLPAASAEFVVYTAAPGAVRVNKITAQHIAQEHAITGVWQEQESQYQIELQLPLEYVQQGVHIEVFDGASQAAVLSNADNIARVVHQITPLQNLLQQFVEPGLRLYIVDAFGFVLADAGELNVAVETDPYAGIAHKAVNALLGAGATAPWQEVKATGRYFTGDSASFTSAGSALKRESKVINRAFSPVSTPVWNGFVVAEKSSSTVDVLVTGATGTLLFYSLMVSVFVGLASMVYASWLSLRIRRLSRLVEDALDAQGNVQVMVARASAKDEIGDLTRSYVTLLHRLKEYTEYLQNLSSKLSHELRTPLAVIKSSLENMQLTGLDASAKLYADRAEAGAMRLSKLLNAMSSANRLEQSLQNADFQQLELKPFLADLIEAYSDVYPHQTFVLQVPDENLTPFYCAPDLIAQMLDKLIENAVDFAASDSNITLALIQQKQHWILQVINVGKPLPEAMQTQLFDSLVTMRSESEGHFGLGLYVVRLIARFHRGSVRCCNLDGGKVMFEVTLPKQV